MTLRHARAGRAAYLCSACDDSWREAHPICKEGKHGVSWSRRGQEVWMASIGKKK